MSLEHRSKRLHHIDFEHSHRGITTSLQIDVTLASVGDNVVDIIVNNTQGIKLGYINGWLKEEYYEVNFYEAVLSNLQKYKQRAGVTVPRVIGGSISQLIQSGFVDAWHSSPIGLLSDEAVDMYERYLASQTQLRVAPPSAG